MGPERRPSRPKTETTLSASRSKLDARMRRDKRYAMQVPVSLRLGKRTKELLTENVSYRGVFVRSDTPVPLRTLLRLNLFLEPLNVEIGVHATSVYVVSTAFAGRRVPGIGAQFFALDGPTRRLWERFVDHVRENVEPSSGRALEATPFPPGAEDVYAHDYSAELLLRCTRADLEHLVHCSFPTRRLFVRTDLDLAVGSEICLEIVHPDTDELYPLSCAVEGVVRDGVDRGAQLTFVDLDAPIEAEFAEFMASGRLFSAVEEEIFIDEEFFVLGAEQSA